MTERALLGPALEHGGGHKIILPRMTVLSHRIVIGEDAELWQTAHHRPSAKDRTPARSATPTTATALSHRPIDLVGQCVSCPRPFLRQDPGDHDPRPARQYFPSRSVALRAIVRWRQGRPAPTREDPLGRTASASRIHCVQERLLLPRAAIRTSLALPLIIIGATVSGVVELLPVMSCERKAPKEDGNREVVLCIHHTTSTFSGRVEPSTKIIGGRCKSR